MRIVSLLALSFLIFIAIKIDPKEGLLGKVLFHVTLFVFLLGIFNLFLLRLRRRFMHGEMVYENIILSFRQGFLLAMLATLLLIFQGLRILVWWDGALIVAGIFLIELYFLSRKNQ
jgi:hypothetical protein